MRRFLGANDAFRRRFGRGRHATTYEQLTRSILSSRAEALRVRK